MKENKIVDWNRSSQDIEFGLIFRILAAHAEVGATLNESITSILNENWMISENAPRKFLNLVQEYYLNRQGERPPFENLKSEIERFDLIIIITDMAIMSGAWEMLFKTLSEVLLNANHVQLHELGLSEELINKMIAAPNAIKSNLKTQAKFDFSHTSKTLKESTQKVGGYLSNALKEIALWEHLSKLNISD